MVLDEGPPAPICPATTRTVLPASETAARAVAPRARWGGRVVLDNVTTVDDGLLTVDRVPVVAALFVPPSKADHLMIAVRSLASAGIHVVAGGLSAELLLPFREAGCECVQASNAADLINQTWTIHRLPVLAVADAVSLPDVFLGRALQLMADDLRVATVSFLSNDAGFLSFPTRNEPTNQTPQGHDASSVSRYLRELRPYVAPTPIPTAGGAMVLLSASALGAVGGLVPGPRAEFAGTLVDFSVRAMSRGFVHLVDDTTFIQRHRAAGDIPRQDAEVDDLHPEERRWINTLYPNEEPFVHHEAQSTTSPLGLTHGLARAKVFGLRVAVDGSYLGPHEMGTQVSILSVVEALSRRHDVREVVVALRSDIPPYAAKTLSLPKVVARSVNFDTLEGLDHCDVAHRLVQPDQWFSVDRWRTVADRVVVTILDLIGYRNGAYHEDADLWLLYRDALRAGATAADAVVVISEDVKLQVEMERLPIDPQRLHAIPIGTEHLTGDEATALPRELAARGFVEGQFILCLGTDYAHKNRDLALAVLVRLRQRGHAHALVLAGPTVPHGSSRPSEAQLMLHHRDTLESDVFVLPDLPSPERNWLMRHADLVLYPSSAEGFGLVPFEAARFGTPTLFTRFGPLQELAPDIPVVAEDWSPDTLADAADSLLTNQAQARIQVESCLAAATKYTWAATAERLAELYRHVMALPPR
jgi:glycosyltransferase involved in cell wall biosynthesis